MEDRERRSIELRMKETHLPSKRVVLAVCTGWMCSEMMASCRKQRVLVGCR